MKKILALILVVLMVASLFACGGTTTTSPSASSSAPAASSAAPESSAPAASVEPTKEADSSGQTNTGKLGDDPMDKVGFYDPTVDYSKNTKYKVQYMVSVTGPLYEMFSNAFAFWAGKMNIDYAPMWASGGDNDAYINNLQTFINQGVNGFLFDPDANSYMRIKEICDEAKVSWFGCMSPPQNYQDEALPMIHPYVGFDHKWFGEQMAYKLDEYMNTVWKDVPKEEIGYLAVDYSLVGVLHDRTVGAQEVWLKLHPEMKDQFFVADTVQTGPTLDGANTVVTAVLSEQTKYTHWLSSVLFDDIAMGTAAAFDTMGLTENAVVVTIGGTSLQRQWDSGVQDSWKFAMFTPQTIYAEPIIGGLYAFMSGQATPETIWPSWVNNTNKDAYARLLLPSYWMDHDNYKKLLEWSDVYAGATEYDYDATGITRDTFNARMDIPEAYNAK